LSKRAGCEDGTYYIGDDGELVERKAEAKRFTRTEAAAYVAAHPALGPECSGLYLSVQFA
jgi:hypothetical protein